MDIVTSNQFRTHGDFVPTYDTLICGLKLQSRNRYCLSWHMAQLYLEMVISFHMKRLNIYQNFYRTISQITSLPIKLSLPQHMSHAHASCSSSQAPDRGSRMRTFLIVLSRAPLPGPSGETIGPKTFAHPAPIQSGRMLALSRLLPDTSFSMALRARAAFKTEAGSAGYHGRGLKARRLRRHSSGPLLPALVPLAVLIYFQLYCRIKKTLHALYPSNVTKHIQRLGSNSVCLSCASGYGKLENWRWCGRCDLTIPLQAPLLELQSCFELKGDRQSPENLSSNNKPRYGEAHLNPIGPIRTQIESLHNPVQTTALVHNFTCISRAWLYCGCKSSLRIVVTRNKQR